MKITQKTRAELFHPQFSVLRLQNKFHAVRTKRPQYMKLKSSQSDHDRMGNNSVKACNQMDTSLGEMKIAQKKRGRNCFTPSFQFSDSKLKFTHCKKRVRSPRN